MSYAEFAARGFVKDIHYDSTAEAVPFGVLLLDTSIPGRDKLLELTCWKQSMEELGYLHPGDEILVTGRIESRTTRAGSYATRVTACNILGPISETPASLRIDPCSGAAPELDTEPDTEERE